ncbi:hypothetical protein TNCV_4812401 [Trichonephila clavipes]|nr:hypothetical protein TNCV_4812401 [Trichonephila clavipes]
MLSPFTDQFNQSTPICPLIKMAPHKPIKPAPVEYITDEGDMIVYVVEEDEIEKKIPADDFVLPEFFQKSPHEYVRALTPTRYRKMS